MTLATSERRREKRREEERKGEDFVDCEDGPPPMAGSRTLRRLQRRHLAFGGVQKVSASSLATSSGLLSPARSGAADLLPVGIIFVTFIIIILLFHSLFVFVLVISAKGRVGTSTHTNSLTSSSSLRKVVVSRDLLVIDVAADEAIVGIRVFGSEWSWT